MLHPLIIGLAVAPVAAVLQSKSLAPIAVFALLGCVVQHRRCHGAWPWPHGALAAVALTLFGWAAVSALWALQPWRALGTGMQLGLFVALGAAAARAVAADTARHDVLLRAACLGLLAGIVVAGLDFATGHAIRAAVRGLAEAPARLAFGLKPAASAMALLLPLLAVLPGTAAWLRGVLLACAAAVLAALPGEAAKLAVLAGALAGGAAWWAPRLAPRLLGAGFAVLILVTPLLLGPVLARGVAAGGLPPSAAHRLLIWDFSVERIAERPLLGWGMEASRTIPGNTASPSPDALRRFGLDGPAAAAWLPSAQLLPLHPHNGALQLWLELGLPGALLGAALALLLGRAAGRSSRPAVAAAMLAAGMVTAMLSFGAWQEWWVGAELLALTVAAALGRSAETTRRPGHGVP